MQSGGVHIQCTAYPVFQNETLQSGIGGHRQVGEDRLETRARMGRIRFVHTDLNNVSGHLDQAQNVMYGRYCV